MSTDPPASYLPTVLDRLVGVCFEGTPAPRMLRERELGEAIGHDLQALLNTRRTSQGVASHHPEVSTSLLHYGLPDGSSLPVSTPQQCNDTARQITAAIRLFEPRIKNPVVEIRRPTLSSDRVLRLRISGQIAENPHSNFQWQGTWEPASGKFVLGVNP